MSKTTKELQQEKLNKLISDELTKQLGIKTFELEAADDHNNCFDIFKKALNSVFTKLSPPKYGAEIEKVISDCLMGNLEIENVMDYSSLLINNVVNSPYEEFKDILSVEEFKDLHTYLRTNVKRWNEQYQKLAEKVSAVKQKEFESSNRKAEIMRK